MRIWNRSPGTDGTTNWFCPGMRFTVRKVAQGWMVWDTESRSVAEVDDRPAIGLTEKTAQRFAEMLNSQDELRDHPQER
jgi:hypothetical protein